MKIPSTKNELAKFIDHTLLSPTATSGEIKRHCQQAVQYGFYCVCVQPRWVATAANLLAKTGVKVDTTAGFPFGADTTGTKIKAAEEAITAGADEIDMVADLAAVIEGDSKYLRHELTEMARLCHSGKVLLKVIIEAEALTDEQIAFVCRIASDAGVDFVKTSTGLHPSGGATVRAVKLMAEYAPDCKIKASGGIRTAEQALELIRAGASRIGTSASVAIIEGFNSGIGK